MNVDAPIPVLNCIKHYEWLDDSCLELKLTQNRLRITFIESSIIRCHYQNGPVFEAVPSYGVDPDYRPTPPKLETCDTRECYVIHTPTHTLRIRKQDAGLEFYERASGSCLSADAEGMRHRYNKENGNDYLWVHKHMPEHAHFFGLGDKPCELNLRGKRFEMWGADHFKFKPSSDPLYKSIPFYICLNEGGCHGIFFDNTMRSYFDFGKERPDRLLFGADGGHMDYYFIGGESGLDVVKNYTRLTGLPPLLPLWALGYQQSRWSYYPQGRVEKLADTFRQKRIPCDTIYLDIHHMKKFQSFTWNRNFFPKPKILMEGLEKQGFKVICIVNPGIKINPDNYVWRSGFERHVFCRRHDGTLLSGDVWPGRCNFPDFTMPETRNWWAKLFYRQISRYKVRGIWVDMNEPVIFPDKTFPSDTRHHFDGYSCSHLKAHNIYGQCMANATRRGMEVHAPARRPFVLSRSGFAGMQRYAATWTGDNNGDWENLKMANLMVQRLASSGVSLAGSDTGGFLGHPTPELFARWMQLSAFHPLYRNHNDGEFGGQEPWCFGENIEAICRHAIETRYKLLPYLYTQAYRYSTEAEPMIRSLCLMHSQDVDTYWRSSEFYCGDAFIVVPVHHAGESNRQLYLPRGQWYCYWDDSSFYSEGQEFSVETPLETIPVFVRGGHIIPHWPLQQYVGEEEHPQPCYDLWWAADSKEQSYHYEDAGDGYGYRIGHYLYHQFEYLSGTKGFILRQSVQGALEPKDERIKCRIHGLPLGESIRLYIDEEEVLEGQYDEQHVLHFLLPTRFRKVQLQF